MSTSPLHTWHPRHKTLALLALLFSIALLQSETAIALSLLLGSLLLAASKIPPKDIARRTKWVVTFSAFIIVIMAVTVGDTPTYNIGPLTMYSEGTHVGLMIAGKAIACIIITAIVVETQQLSHFLHALEDLGLPNKLVQVITFTQRYFCLLQDEYNRKIRAATARHFIPTTSPKTLTTVGTLLGALIISSFERSQRVYQAMTNRGYTGTLPHDTLPPATPRDVVQNLATIGIALSLHLI